MKIRVIAIIVIFLSLTGIVLLIYSKPMQIAYHLHALERVHEAIYAKPSATVGGFVAYGNRELFERQDKHCQRLVELGYFFHKRYEMENLPNIGGVHSAFWHLILKDFPNRRYVKLSYLYNDLEVWDRAEHEPKWDAFVAKHNVPDFVDRFMKPSKVAAPTDEGEPK